MPFATTFKNIPSCYCSINYLKLRCTLFCLLCMNTGMSFSRASSKFLVICLPWSHSQTLLTNSTVYENLPKKEQWVQTRPVGSMFVNISDLETFADKTGLPMLNIIYTNIQIIKSNGVTLTCLLFAQNLNITEQEHQNELVRFWIPARLLTKMLQFYWRRFNFQWLYPTEARP